jgi:hypothetical protein
MLPPNSSSVLDFGAHGGPHLQWLGLPWASLNAAAPPLSLTLMLALTCCTISLIVGILAIGFLAAMKGRRSKTDNGGEDRRPK